MLLSRRQHSACHSLPGRRYWLSLYGRAALEEKFSVSEHYLRVRLMGTLASYAGFGSSCHSPTSFSFVESHA
jgi:hypothetical protein